MRVSVTAEHIAKSKYPRDSGTVNCPVGRALEDIGHGWGFYNEAFIIGPVGEDDTPHIIALPNKVKKFMKRFDHGHKVSPLEFEFDENGGEIC